MTRKLSDDFIEIVIERMPYLRESEKGNLRLSEQVCLRPIDLARVMPSPKDLESMGMEDAWKVIQRCSMAEDLYKIASDIFLAQDLKEAERNMNEFVKRYRSE